MATASNSRPRDLPHPRLWFGAWGAAAAWVALGCIDILINWRACQHQMDYGLPPAQIGPRILIGCVGVSLVALALIAGLTSYSSWKKLTREKHVLNTTAVERPEFMAFFGMIVSATMGMGTVWLTLIPIFLNICWRAK